MKAEKISIDKIKLTYKCRDFRKKIFNLEFFEEELIKYKFYVEQKWDNFQIGSNHKNYKIKSPTNEIIYFGIGQNSTKGLKPYCQIEFNPNKQNTLLTPFLNYLVQESFKFFEINSFDMAFDYSLTPENFKIILNNDNTNLMAYGTRNNLTWYIAPKAEQGRIKIYNKAIEQKVDRSWTRVEISISNVSGFSFCEIPLYISSKINQVYLNNNPYTDDAFIYLLCKSDNATFGNALEKFSRNTRSKYKMAVKDALTPLTATFDIEQIENLLNKTLTNYSTLNGLCQEVKDDKTH